MKKSFKIEDTDLFFRSSPDAGDDDCICSRCRSNILEHENVWRQALSSDDFYTVNPDGSKDYFSEGADGFEFRLCPKCVKKYYS